MKQLYLFILFSSWSIIGFAQISITEISYNPPEGGTDSLEYIELYNTTTSAINLTGYQFSKGITHAFTEGTIDAKSYMVLAINKQAMKNVFGVDVLQWTGGALQNGGEEITLVDASGNKVASVTYMDVAPWPTIAEGTDGNGRSIELCNPDADPNDGNNWKVSETNIGITINGFEVYGTPGKANSIPDCGSNADVVVMVSSNVFTPADITIEVGQSVEWQNTGGNHNVNGTQTTFPSNPASFSSGSASTDLWKYRYTFDVPGLYNYQCDPHASLGMKGTVTVNMPVIIDLYPKYDIITVSSVNGVGVPDSLGVLCKLEGYVYGGNLRPGGLQFFLLDDNNNGIGVFDSSFDFGYTVTEGDKVEVKGMVVQFNGYTQIDVAEITLISQGHTLVNPKVIQNFEENDESSLVMLQNLSFTDPSQWTGSGSGFNVTMTDGTHDFTIRIDNDVDLYSMSIPSGAKFNVTGLLSQYDNSEPYDSGYQLMPRYAADIEEVSGTSDGENNLVHVFPNPVQDHLFVTFPLNTTEAKIISTIGETSIINFNDSSIDVSQLLEGLYILEVKTETSLSRVKFIKIK